MPLVFAVERWMRTAARHLSLLPDTGRDEQSPRPPRPGAPAWERVPPELRGVIARGRACLAASAKEEADKIAADKIAANEIEADDRAADTARDPRREDSPCARMLALLWHTDANVRECAARALCGGDGVQAHIGEYGHFVGAFGRGLRDTAERGLNHSPLQSDAGGRDTIPDAAFRDRPATMPATASARYECVARTLCALLDQSIGEIRGMSSMNYSFLSSALYLAVLATCRDTVCAIGRLRVIEAHGELCRLLWNLSQMSVLRRCSGQDLETLARATGQALAALPPDAIPDFWHGLTCAGLPRRLAVAPALAYMDDKRAVPYLLDALNAPDAHGELTGLIASCLGRLKDVRALSALRPLAQSRDRVLRQQVNAAIAAIERAGRGKPQNLLLRPVIENADRNSETMLRPAPVNEHDTAPHPLLRRSAGTHATRPVVSSVVSSKESRSESPGHPRTG